jgi:hypothetical protein
MIERLMCAVMALVLLAGPVLADVIVLKDGERFTGTIANREQVRADPGASPTISILLSDSNELQRFRLGDVDYLILDDPTGQQVVDLSSARASDLPAAPATMARLNRQKYGGLLMFAGVLAGGVGLVHKFGGPKCELTNESVNCDDHSFDGTNYALMAGGGLLVVLGIVEMASGSESPRVGLSPKAKGLGLLVRAGPRSTEVGVSYALRF